MIAVRILDQNIIRRAFNRDTLIAIRDLKIVEMAVIGADKVDTVGTTYVATTRTLSAGNSKWIS